ncbi:MAG: hypothetical protein L6Q57_06395 [Alphaproteobacteria bacterium]|nr:hypothetical protein [Alphaproteobacteria bacterium]
MNIRTIWKSVACAVMGGVAAWEKALRRNAQIDPGSAFNSIMKDSIGLAPDSKVALMFHNVAKDVARSISAPQDIWECIRNIALNYNELSNPMKAIIKEMVIQSFSGFEDETSIKKVMQESLHGIDQGNPSLRFIVDQAARARIEAVATSTVASAPMAAA